MKVTFTASQIKKIFGKRVQDFTCSFRCRSCSSMVWMFGNGEQKPFYVTCPICGKQIQNIFSKMEKPLLQTLIDNESIWIENGYYVGKASDGEIVQIGHDEKSTIEYLKSNPSPDTW